MEPQPIPMSHILKKRKRKASLPGNASKLKKFNLVSVDETKLKHKVLKKSKSVKPKIYGVNKLELPNQTNLKSDNKPEKGIAKNADVSQKQKAFKPNLHSQLKPKSTGAITILTKPKKKISDAPMVKEKTYLSDADGSLNDEPLLTKATIQTTTIPKVAHGNSKSDDIEDKFPVLKNKELIDRFMKVPMSNNQKGRIRQALKLSLQGSSNTMFPEIINGKIQAILDSSSDLTDSDLRRIRLLYNMLKTAVEAPADLEVKSPKKKKNKKKNEKGDDMVVHEKGEKDKVRGPKRYVVFIGNLPLNVNKEMIMNHFKELNEQIKDIRIPKVADGTKSAIAYVELNNEPSYELALSKHHSMLRNKRIRVLYTTQQNSKISRSEAKGKSAKLIALQKSGKLVGSVPAGKTRNHRRAIMKRAKAKESVASG